MILSQRVFFIYLMTYPEKLKSPRWQKRRLKILDRDNWMCKLCGDTETTFHVHHKKYTNDPWDAPDEDLISYCCHCHSVVEQLKNHKDGLIPIEVLKWNDEIGDGFLIACVANKPNTDLCAIMYFVYANCDDSIVYVFTTSPVVVRDLNKRLDIVKARFKEQFNGE